MQHDAAANQWSGFIASFLGDFASAALGWAVVFGFAGLVTAIVFAAVLARKGLLRREPRMWNALAKLAYPALFVGLTLAGAALGAVYGAQRQAHEALRTAVQPVIAANLPAYRTYVGEALSGYVPDQRVTVRELIEPYVKVYYYVPKSGSAWERTKARVVNELMLRYAADVFIERFEAVMSTQLELLDEKLGAAAGGGATRFTARQVTDFFTGRSSGVDWTKLDATLPGVIVAALGERLDGYCRSVYAGIALIVALLMLPLAVESAVYFRVYRRRSEPATER